MWRGLVLCCLLAGCNTILGVHDFDYKDGGGGDDGSAESCDVEAVACGVAHAVQCTTNTCQCAAGYRSTGNACEWVGVVTNPEVSDASKWTLAGGSTIDDTSSGTDIGLGHVPCAGGSITQAITMPRYADAEPLVAVMTIETSAGQLGMSLGSVTHDYQWPLFTMPSYTTFRSCLGAGEYAPPTSTGRGAQLTFAAIPTVAGGCGVQSVALDHFEIVPAAAGECPTPGNARNGDAEATNGWDTTFKSNANDLVEFAAGAGEAGTAGLRLLVDKTCEMVKVRNVVSIPDTPSPALELFRKSLKNGVASAPEFVSAELERGGLQFTDATTATERYCLPRTLRGGAYVLDIKVEDTSTGCGTTVQSQVIVDNVVAYDDPACGTDPAIADPSFESGYAVAWVSEARRLGNSKVDNVVDADARSGTHLLLFSRTGGCGPGRFTTRVVVPPASGNAGPALAFQYRTATTAPYPLVVQSGAALASTALMDDAWHSSFVCLPPQRTGRSAVVSFIWEVPGGMGCGAISSTYAKVDDLQLTTNAACPAQ